MWQKQVDKGNDSCLILEKYRQNMQHFVDAIKGLLVIRDLQKEVFNVQGGCHSLNTLPTICSGQVILSIIYHHIAQVPTSLSGTCGGDGQLWVELQGEFCIVFVRIKQLTVLSQGIFVIYRNVVEIWIGSTFHKTQYISGGQIIFSQRWKVT